MKRDFLRDLGLSDDLIEKVMSEYGKDIEGVNTKYADYDDLKKQIETANATLDKFKDYDQTKAEVEKYKAEVEKARQESEKKIAQLERTAKVKDFTSSKKFINDITRDSINKMLEDKLADESSKGKSLEELLNGIIEGKTDIFKTESVPQPPTVPIMGNAKGNTTDDDSKLRSIMGLGSKKE